MTFSEIQTVYNRLNKSWRDLSWPDKTIALRELRDHDFAARSLRTHESDDLPPRSTCCADGSPSSSADSSRRRTKTPGLEY